MSKAISRRDFLKVTGAVGAAGKKGRNSLSYHIHPFSSECLMLRFLASTMARFILVSMKIRTATLSPKHL